MTDIRLVQKDEASLCFYEVVIKSVTMSGCLVVLMWRGEMERETLTRCELQGRGSSKLLSEAVFRKAFLHASFTCTL